MQLTPYENFPIVRYIKDPTETGTLYVQAKVYDSATHATLDTVNLDADGTDNHWFSKSWHVPHDNAYGNGRHIVIITTVFTDSGYTTKAAYEEESTEYIIQQRWSQALGSMGGGSSIDEAMLKKILKEALDAVEKPKERKDLTLDEIVSGVSRAIVIPPQEKIDFSPLLRALEDVGRRISALPKPVPTDLSPLEMRIATAIGAILELGKAIRSVDEEHRKGMQKLSDGLGSVSAENKRLNKVYNDTGSAFQNIINGVSDVFSSENKKQKKSAYFQKLLNGIKT